MTGRLQGRVAIVTGAGSVGPGWGNGKAAAVLFAREGAKIFAADISLDAALETKAIIEAVRPFGNVSRPYSSIMERFQRGFPSAVKEARMPCVPCM